MKKNLLLLITVGVLLPGFILGQNIYYTDMMLNKINKVVDVSTSQEILTSVTKPAEIAIDEKNNHIYICSAASNTIVRSNLDGSNLVNIITTEITRPFAIALDVDKGKIYWSDIHEDKIKRANLDGSAIETIATVLNDDIYSLAIDCANNKIYWSESMSNKIRKANLDGSGQEDVLTGLSMPYGIDLDIANNEIYWIEVIAPIIKKSKLDGTNITEIISFDPEITERVKIDFINSKLIYMLPGQSKIYSCNLNGSGLTTVNSTTNGLTGLALTNYRGEVTFSDGSTFIPAMTKGETNQAFGRFKLTRNSGSNIKMMSVRLKLNGVRSGISNFKFWRSSDETFNAATDTQLGVVVEADPGNGSYITFNNFVDEVTADGVYYFITGNISADASGSIQAELTDNSNIGISNNGLVISTLVNSSTSNAAVAMPVELTSFAANVLDGKVILNWATATEQNNYGFEIERQEAKVRNQNSEWVRFGFVDGAGNSNSLNTYNFIDENAGSGKFKYRLKQIDVDGSFEYSNEVEITVGIPNEFALEQNYPNPFNPSTIISYSVPEESFVTISVYNAVGEKIRTLTNQKMAAGKYSMEFRANGLPSGIYFYRMKTEKNEIVKKMILMK